MNRCVPHLLRFAAAFGAALSAARADSELVAKSPFMTPSAANAAAPTAGAPLEYRGMMETSAGTKVRIVDPSKKGGAWLLVNERDPGFDFVVKKIDIEHETVTLDYQGRPLTLAQHVAKVASAGVAPNFPNVAQNGPPMPAAITSSVVVNPTPADEQRRLDAVAAEVARRRALREQAAQQGGQGVPIAPQIIQQQQMQAPQPPPQNLQQQQQQNNAAQRGAALRGQRGRGTP